MMAAPMHKREEKRLEALKKAKLLDTPKEAKFDSVIFLASEICETNIALFSIVDEKRQWFKSKLGLDVEQTDRSISFCGHTILTDDILEVRDTLKDTRFLDNPLVTGYPNIRFYAGAPVLSTDGLPIGTLCVIDQKPMQLTPYQLESLKKLALKLGKVVAVREEMLHLQEQHLQLEKQREELKKYQSKIIKNLRDIKVGFFNSKEG